MGGRRCADPPPAGGRPCLLPAEIQAILDGCARLAGRLRRGGTPYVEIVPREDNPNEARVKMMRPAGVYVGTDLEQLFADYLTISPVARPSWAC